MKSTAALKHVALGLVLGMLLLAFLLVRAGRNGTQAMLDSDAAFDRGQLSLSMLRAGDAMRWYFPFAPHVVAAKTRLLAIAEGAEASGDLRLAQGAWSSLHAALVETGHPFGPSDPLLVESERAIVRLLPHPGGLLNPQFDPATLLATYTRPERNEPIFYAARSAGMALLLLGVWLLFLRARQRGLVAGALCVACGLFAWVFAAIGA